jgi:hypothetical protein
MYLSAERLAVANKAVQETFEQASIAWQAIPHWDVGDPGQIRVRDGVTSTPGFLPLDAEYEDFNLTWAQACAPSPDAVLGTVIAKTVDLATKVDKKVVELLYNKATPSDATVELDPKPDVQGLLDALIDARLKVEDYGYRAPSCLLVSKAGLKKLSYLVGVEPVTQYLLSAANINSLHRAQQLDDYDKRATTGKKQLKALVMLLLGRRQRIAHGCAAKASPGEEPVDLAVSVPPSLEVVGETATGYMELSVRIRFATRIKDPYGVVRINVKEPP